MRKTVLFATILLSMLLLAGFVNADIVATRDTGLPFQSTIGGYYDTGPVQKGSPFEMNVRVRFLHDASDSALVVYAIPFGSTAKIYLGTRFSSTPYVAGKEVAYQLHNIPTDSLPDTACENYIYLYVDHWTCSDNCERPTDGKSFSSEWTNEGYYSRIQNTPKIVCKPQCTPESLGVDCGFANDKFFVQEKKKLADCTTVTVPIEECAGICAVGECLNTCDRSVSYFCKDTERWQREISEGNNCEPKDTLKEDCPNGCEGGKCKTLAPDPDEPDDTPTSKCGNQYCESSLGESTANCPADCQTTQCNAGEKIEKYCDSGDKITTHLCSDGIFESSGVVCPENKTSSFDWRVGVGIAVAVLIGLILLRKYGPKKRGKKK
jgi:hypothetical protein